MSQNPKKALLNPYQKNSLRITLRMFEENLHNALEWLDGREDDGILYSRKLILSPDRREQAREHIKVALGVIEKLSHQFDLRKESSDAASALCGELTVGWANLLDTRAKKLGRYGKVHPELVSVLDSDIQKLAEIAQQLSAIIGKS
jgi:hypothetical protein